MFIEGKNAVRQAILAQQTINKVMVSETEKGRKDTLIDLLFSNKIKVEFLPKSALDKKLNN